MKWILILWFIDPNPVRHINAWLEIQEYNTRHECLAASKELPKAYYKIGQVACVYKTDV